jgi:hypothetical protein
MMYLDDTLTEAELAEANTELRDEANAARIVRNAVAELQERAVTEWPDDWSDYSAYRRYVALLASGTGYVGADGSPVVRVTGPDIDVWGYVASDALDGASQNTRGYLIDQMRPGAYRLVKPTIANHGEVWRIVWANGTRCVSQPSGGHNALGEPWNRDAGKPIDFSSMGEALKWLGYM